MVKSTVVDNETGKSIDSTVRTSTGTFFARQARARLWRAAAARALPAQAAGLLGAAAPSTPNPPGGRRRALAGGTASAECPGRGAPRCRRVRWDGPLDAASVARCQKPLRPTGRRRQPRRFERLPRHAASGLLTARGPGAGRRGDHAPGEAHRHGHTPAGGERRGPADPALRERPGAPAARARPALRHPPAGGRPAACSTASCIRVRPSK